MCRTIHKIALITNLTQSLVDIELKYDSTTDKPMYRERGADTWLPFKKDIELTPYNPSGTCYIYLPQGAYSKVTYVQAEYGSGTVQYRTGQSSYITLSIDVPQAIDPSNQYAMLLISQGLQARIRLETA